MTPDIYIDKTKTHHKESFAFFNPNLAFLQCKLRDGFYRLLL